MQVLPYPEALFEAGQFADIAVAAAAAAGARWTRPSPPCSPRTEIDQAAVCVLVFQRLLRRRRPRNRRGGSSAGCTSTTAERALGSSHPPARLAVDETVVLLHPPLHLSGVSIATERERQQNESLANGQARPGA